MKVLYFALGGRGGSDKALFDLLSVFKRDYDIVPLVICGRKDIVPELDKIKVPSVYYNFEWSICPPLNSAIDKFLYFPRRLKAAIRRKCDIKNLLKIVSEFNPDLLHSNVGVINVGYRLGQKTKIPHIWHVREYQRLDHGMRYVGGEKHFKRELARNKFNIGITKSLFDYFELKSPSVHIYDGVRSLRKGNNPPSSQKKYFVFAGFLFSGKGIEELLYSYKKYIAKGGNCGLYILGKYNEQNKYHLWIKQYINNYSLNEVKLLGFRSDVDEIMAQSCAVIVPSRFEAFGRVTCEAMFNKTIVIGKNTAGTKEQFDNLDNFVGRNISLRYSTQDELVERMFQVESMDDKLRKEIIEKSFELVNQLYSNEISAASVYQYYKKVLNNNTPTN